MTRPTKRAQVEALGWILTPIPRHWAEGALWSDSRTGRRSAAHDDYKRPEAWVVTPPDGHPVHPRRFNNASPIPAVRWAYDQAMAPQPSPELGGVAALALMASVAQATGVVMEGDDNGGAVPALPDAELLALCREIAGCERIADVARQADACPWNQSDTFQAATAQVSEARRTKDRLVPRVLELDATTPAGALAKARVVLGLFASSSGQKAAAVRALVADLAAVLDPAAAVRRIGT